MIIMNYRVTPGNVHDSLALKPLLDGMDREQNLSIFKQIYGDNAYDTNQNHIHLEDYGIQCQFHTKEDTGKKPKKLRRARKKSRIRSKAECIFGIFSENYDWGQFRVKSLKNVTIEVGLLMISWNFFYLMAHVLGFPEHCRSLKQILSQK